MGRTDELLKQIELLRKTMVETAVKNGYTSVESITLSQELDKLLNLYDHVKNNDKRK